MEELLALGMSFGVELEYFLLKMFYDSLCHQVVDGGLGEHDVIGKCGQLVHGEVFFQYQLVSCDGWYP